MGATLKAGKPFVGCILSPYGDQSHGCASTIRWFLTEAAGQGTASKRLGYSIIPAPIGMSGGDLSPDLKGQIRMLINALCGDPQRWRWTDEWDDNAAGPDGYATISRLCKCITSLFSHVLAAAAGALHCTVPTTLHFNDVPYHEYDFYSSSPPSVPIPACRDLTGSSLDADRHNKFLDMVQVKQSALKRLEHILLVAWGVP